MRQETDKIARAFFRRTAANAARTRTNGEIVWLHNNRIAWRTLDGDIGFTLAGWPTVTTRERINGILTTFGYRYWNVAQRDHAQYLVLGCRRHGGGEKMMPLGDHDHFYLSELRAMEPLPCA